MAVYDRSTGLLLQQFSLPRVQNTLINPGMGSSCPTPGTGVVAVRLNRFEATVSLPAAADGYYAFYTESARNIDITNLVRPEDEALTLYTDLAPPTLPNSSPIFADTAVAVICQGEPSTIINNAYDPDGDRLEYAFGTPYGGSYRNVAPLLLPAPARADYLPGPVRRGPAVRAGAGQLRLPRQGYGTE